LLARPALPANRLQSRHRPESDR